MNEEIKNDDIHSSDTNGEDCDDFVPQGLVFDCDGTLVDSMNFFYHSWEVACPLFGIEITKQQFFSFAGLPVPDIFHKLVEEQFADGKRERPKLEDFLKAKKAVVDQDQQRSPPGRIDCVVDIVKQFHKRIPMAVASSGKKENVMGHLLHNDLLKYFDAVVTIEDVVNGKPAPDLFLLACKKIGVAPELCRGYEDADIGIISLQRAGLNVVDVRLLPGYPK
jgi:beta-phosphoglucomutase-like phosphatase (HAD superfamily)